MGLLTWLMLYKIWTMDDKIDQQQKQLRPSETPETPETAEDIEEWLKGHDNGEEEAVELQHPADTPETAEDIEEWLNESNDIE